MTDPKGTMRPANVDRWAAAVAKISSTVAALAASRLRR
jgi:hypothetical protein